MSTDTTEQRARELFYTYADDLPVNQAGFAEGVLAALAAAGIRLAGEGEVVVDAGRFERLRRVGRMAEIAIGEATQFQPGDLDPIPTTTQPGTSIPFGNDTEGIRNEVQSVIGREMPFDSQLAIALADMADQRDACVTLENICNGQLETVMGERDALAERVTRYEAFVALMDEMREWFGPALTERDEQRWDSARAAIDAQGETQ